MEEDFEVIKNSAQDNSNSEGTSEPKDVGTEGGKVIDEANYRIRGPKESGPSAVGRGGDPLFRRIRASKEQLLELMEENWKLLENLSEAL